MSSYSIKQVEELYEFQRTASVSGGTAAIVLFERWLESGVDELLEGIDSYNQEDCRSLEALHKWLLGQRPTELPWRPEPVVAEKPEEGQAEFGEREHLRAALLDGATEDEPRWLLAQLLDYHHREAKPAWWEYFYHRDLDDEELLEDSDTIGCLTLIGDPVPDRRSLEYTFSFPSQEHKIDGRAVDPRRAAPAR